ncbi:MAG: RidA family protein [Nakamurella sp.]
MSTIEYINPPELGPPSGFSNAVRVGSAVYLAGQTALDDTGTIVGDTMVEQFDKAVSNMLTALQGAGGRPEHLVSLTVYIVDMEQYKSNLRGIGEVWKRRIGTVFPAMAAVGVARLWDIEALVEVQGIAHLS